MRAKSSFTRAAAACCAQASAAGTCGTCEKMWQNPRRIMGNAATLSHTPRVVQMVLVVRLWPGYWGRLDNKNHNICWEKLPHLHNSSCDIHRGPWGTGDTSISTSKWKIQAPNVWAGLDVELVEPCCLAFIASFTSIPTPTKNTEDSRVKSVYVTG